MKVLFVSRGIPFYGISPIMLRQGESLMKKGIELDYFKIEGKGALAYLKGIFKLRNYLSKKNIDIIHAHYGLCGIVTLFGKKNEKTVLSFMGSELLGITKFQGLSLKKIISSTINNFCIKKFDAIIVKSDAMANQIKSKNCYVIPNGVDLYKFTQIDKINARKKLNLPLECKLVIFICDPPNRPEKNQQLVEAAVNLINDPNITLKFLSRIDQDTLNNYYSAADLLALTSYHEGSPNVIKEAMACGCPIVATDVGDIKKNINGVEGCYISSFEKEDVSSKIKEAISFSESYGRTSGRQRIIQLGIDSDSISNRILSVYKNILQTKNK